MTGPEIMGAAGFILLLLGYAFGVWKYVDGKLSDLRKEISDHRLHSAETFATKAGLTEALGRVHDALDRLTDRIDTLIASQAKPPRRTS